MQHVYGTQIDIKMGMEFGIQTHTISKYESLFSKYPFDFIISVPMIRCSLFTIICKGSLEGAILIFIQKGKNAQLEIYFESISIISNLEYRFYKAYGMEIEDKRTVYGECTYHMVPREDEPSVCLMHDWIYLPSA